MIKLKKLFKNLQTDARSVLFTEEKINKVLKNWKTKNTIKTFVNLFRDNANFLNGEKNIFQ